VDVVRFFARLKCSLMPHLYAFAVEAARRGLPMMRAMFLEFPDDPACAGLDRQYMLGDSLLVAPVFSETGEVEYYLPAGEWTRLLSGERVLGGRWIRERHGYLSLPLLAREGSLVAFGAVDERPDYEWAEGAELRLHALAKGAIARAAVPRLGAPADAEPALAVEVSRSGDTYAVRASGIGGPWSLLVVGAHSGEAQGAKIEAQATGLGVVPDSPNAPFSVRVVS